jgi:hypothetical protein
MPLLFADARHAIIAIAVTPYAAATLMMPLFLPFAYAIIAISAIIFAAAATLFTPC